MFLTAHWWHDEMAAFALVLAHLSGLKKPKVVGSSIFFGYPPML
jgi:hypothetical protein